MSNTAPSRADPVVVFPFGRWWTLLRAPAYTLVGECKALKTYQARCFQTGDGLNPSSVWGVTWVTRLSVLDGNSRTARPMTMPLHIDGPRWFNTSWDNMNLSISNGVKHQQEFECLMEIPARANGPTTKRLHIYRPRWFHRTWDGANQSSGLGVRASAKSWWKDGWMDGRTNGQTEAI